MGAGDVVGAGLAAAAAGADVGAEVAAPDGPQAQAGKAAAATIAARRSRGVIVDVKTSVSFWRIRGSAGHRKSDAYLLPAGVVVCVPRRCAPALLLRAPGDWPYTLPDRARSARRRPGRH